MQAKTFVGKITVRIGEYENDVTRLLVANSRESAWDVLEESAQCYYGDENTPEEDGGYYANGGEIFVCAKGLEEIGLATFLELKRYIMVFRQENVTVPDESALDAPLNELARAFTQALNRTSKVVSHSQVLNALASAYGHKNWHVLKNKLEAFPQLPEARPVQPVKPAEPIDAEYHAWVVLEVQRVGQAQVRFIEDQGYTIRDNGTGSGWYALLPGETEMRTQNEDHNYLGFFSSLDDLVEELLAKLNYLPDEVARGLCLVHRLPVWSRKTEQGTRWNDDYATEGDAARAALSKQGISYGMAGSRLTKSVEFTRRLVANAMFESHNFGSTVEAVNGWVENSKDCMERAVFLSQGLNEPTRKVVFTVAFDDRSAMPTGWGMLPPDVA